MLECLLASRLSHRRLILAQVAAWERRLASRWHLYSTVQYSTVQHSTAQVAPEDPRHQAEVVQPGGRVHGELQGGEGGALGPVVLASQARGAARGHITGTRGTVY